MDRNRSIGINASDTATVEHPVRTLHRNHWLAWLCQMINRSPAVTAMMGVTPAAMLADVPAAMQAAIAMPIAASAEGAVPAMPVAAFDLDCGGVSADMLGEGRGRCGGGDRGERKGRSGNEGCPGKFHYFNPCPGFD